MQFTWRIHTPVMLLTQKVLQTNSDFSSQSFIFSFISLSFVFPITSMAIIESCDTKVRDPNTITVIKPPNVKRLRLFILVCINKTMQSICCPVLLEQPLPLPWGVKPLLCELKFEEMVANAVESMMEFGRGCSFLLKNHRIDLNDSRQRVHY